MTDENIPLWARQRAVKMLNDQARNNWYSEYDDPVTVLARMIAKHEKPPVDPDEEALKRILKTVCVVKEHCGGNWHSALAQYKKEIGRG